MTIKRNLGSAFDFVHRVIENPDAFPDRMVVLPFDPKLLSTIFTEERLRLWRELHRGKTHSISELAEKLKRDVSRVRQDLLLLEQVHLVELKRHGNKVEPWPKADNILVASP